MKKTELKIGTAICLILFTVAGIAGIAALFLPFTFGVSPVEVVVEEVVVEMIPSSSPYNILLLGIPFFLSVFVSAAFVRWMISGLLSRAERASAYVISSMMALIILYVIIDLFLSILPDLSERYFCLTLFIIPLFSLLFGVYVVIKNLRSNGPKEISAIMAMQIVYLSNAFLPLILFFENWEIGAYFVVFTSGIYLTQIVMATVKFGVFRRKGERGSV